MLLATGCTKYVEAEPVTVIETVTETITVTEYIEVEDTDCQLELDKYKSLIDNLNEYLGYVYYGYAENDNYILDGFTAFSMNHKGKYYLITAGHCVENDSGKFNSFKFRANFTDTWIYPELLIYDSSFAYNRDYAVFYSDSINNGFNIKIEEDYPLFILGHGELNTIKKFSRHNNNPGESGSPVINLSGEAVGIATGDLTDIDLVLEAIDNIDK